MTRSVLGVEQRVFVLCHSPVRRLADLSELHLLSGAALVQQVATPCPGCRPPAQPSPALPTLQTSPPGVPLPQTRSRGGCSLLVACGSAARLTVNHPFGIPCRTFLSPGVTLPTRRGMCCTSINEPGDGGAAKSSPAVPVPPPGGWPGLAAGCPPSRPRTPPPQRGGGKIVMCPRCRRGNQRLSS